MKKFLGIELPSSKSIANRVLILAALSEGRTTLKGDFDAQDIQIMIHALQKLGLRIMKMRQGLRIENDLSWQNSFRSMSFHLGNSGTSFRFLTSLLIFRKGVTILTGSQRMKERPIGDLVDSLRQLGAQVDYLERNGYPPIRISGADGIAGAKVSIKGDMSSQFISSLLLIGPFLKDGLEISLTSKLISKPYLDLTRDVIERWWDRGSKSLVIEGDASAAVYFWAHGFLHQRSVYLKNLPARSLQPDAKFPLLLERLKRHHSRRNCTIDMSDMPDASLMLMALAPTLSFPMTIRGLQSLRIKECDRTTAMATGLKKLGVRLRTGKSWIQIHPGFRPSQTKTVIETFDDHRIAMSFGVLASKIPQIKILNPACVRKTYPNFWRDLRLLSSG